MMKLMIATNQTWLSPKTFIARIKLTRRIATTTPTNFISFCMVVIPISKLLDYLWELVKPGLSFDPFGSANCAFSKADAGFSVVGKENCVIR